MRAVVLEGVGGPEQLVPRDVPEPEAGEGRVVVDVRAAGINFLDVLVRQGRYAQAPELPWVPGCEVAGEVDGRRVAVLGPMEGGGYAERAAVDEEWLFDLPEGASFAEGASFLMAFLTAWIPMTRQASVQPGVRVLVTAAAGAVGSAAVQVARVLGAEVVGAAGDAAKLDLVRSLGAAAAVTYDRLEELGRVDVVLDPVGGDVFDASLRLLRPLGTVLPVGYAGGPWPPLDPAVLVGRNVGVAGFYLGRLLRLEPALVRQAAEDLMRLWGRGLLRPVVGATFALERAAEAHALLESRATTGKVVLEP